MKNILVKFSFLALVAVSTVSCIGEDDYVIPPVKEVLFNETFESTTTGSGANEVAISLPGWTNTAVVGNRKWHSRAFSGNKYAEFSSFYSDAATAPNDEVWLVTPAINLSTLANPVLSFQTKIRFYTGDALKVYISEDFDGTVSGITSATWTQLNPVLPTSAQTETFISSGNIDLSAYSENVFIAFKYTGSKLAGGVTTTYQLDNIRINEN